MLNIIWLFCCIFLIILILARIPNNTGLGSISIKNNFLGSPSSVDKFLNKLTWGLIIIYFLLASKFNLFI